MMLLYYLFEKEKDGFPGIGIKEYVGRAYFFSVFISTFV